MNKRYIFGQWQDAVQPLSVAEGIAICEMAAEYRLQVARYPLHKVLALLARVQARWADPAYDRRVRLKNILPQELGFSPAMVELGLERVAMILDPHHLKKKVMTEFAGIPRTSGYKFIPESHTGLRWYPLGSLLHVLAGNGFLGAASSLLEGMLTGNVNILKMASGRTSFLPELLMSIQEMDHDGVISQAIAAIDYQSSQRELIAEFKKRVDGIIVWGGEEAVRSYRDGLPARTRIIVFGPKMSLGLVTQRGLEEKTVAAVAKGLAAEIATWDQSACTAPQLCYVEGEKQAVQLCDALAVEMENIGKRLPIGDVPADAAIEIRKHRGLALIDESRQQGLLKASKEGLEYTVYMRKDLRPEPSPLYRTLRIVPYQELADVVTEFTHLRGYIQTVGLIAAESEFTDVSHQLAQAGCLRMVQLGKMSYGEVDDPHDGAYDLPQLMYLVFNRLQPRSSAHALVDMISTKERNQWIDERLSQLSYKRNEFANLQVALGSSKLETRSDLTQFSVMVKTDIDDFEVDSIRGGYVSRSGGSTGAPKFSVYDGQDWEAMIDRSVDVLRAAGLNQNDRVANCLSAGDLYGGFVSFDHINCRIGALSLAFAATENVETLVHSWRTFRFNVVQGMPSHIIPLLREAKSLEPNFSIETFIFGGMPLLESDATWLSETLGAIRIAAIMGANDGGPIGFQCEYMSGNEYHTIDDYNFMELVDANDNEVATGEVGRVVITSLLKYQRPLIRYQIGDLGRLLKEPCKCGRTSRRWEYCGRIEDSVLIDGKPMTYLGLSQHLRGLGISQLQLELRPSASILRIEGEFEGSDKIAARTKERFKGHPLENVELAVYSPGGIPRNAGSVKIKGIIDNR